MPRYYNATWIGDGSAENFYRVAADKPRLIDLRPDETVPEGRVLVRMDDALPSVPSGWTDLGDGLDVSMPRGVSRALERVLSVSLDQFDTLRSIIAELLILHGEDLPRGVRSKWRPIKADHRGMHRIILGETIYEAPAVQGALVSDDFNRTDAEGLGAGWTLESEGWWINTNRAERGEQPSDPGNSSGLGYARFDTDLDTDDHSVKAFDMNTAGVSTAGLTLRHSSTEVTYYHSRIHVGDHIRFFKRVTGTYTQIFEGDALGLSDPYTVDFYSEFDGSSWSVEIDDVQVESGTDTSITGNTRAGMLAEPSGSPFDPVFYGSWQAQDLGAGAALLKVENETEETSETDLSLLDLIRIEGESEEASETDLSIILGFVSLLATGTQAIADVVNELDNTIDLHLSVDDDPDTPDDNDWINNNLDLSGGDASVFFPIDDLPTDFGNAETAEVEIRAQGVDISATLHLYVQIFQSDETTPMSDEVEAVAISSSDTFTNYQVVLTGLDTASNKAVWDGAVARFRWSTT